MKNQKKRKMRIWRVILPLMLCLCCIVQAAEKNKVTMEVGRWIDYPHYWGMYGTHFYTAHTEDGPKMAYCLEPDKNQVPAGDYEAEMVQENDGLRAALYYGYGGPGQKEYIDQSEYNYIGDSSVEDAKYVRTHLAVSYFYDPEHAFHKMDEGDVLNSGVWEFINWLNNKEIPSVSSRFSESSLTAYYEKGADFQRTKSMQYVSDNGDNRISIACPEGVKLHNETTGRIETGQVSVKAGERFYFTAPLDIVSSLGTVWKTGTMLGEKDGRWEAMTLPAVGNGQVSGYGCYSTRNITPVEFQVQWISLGKLELQKTDLETGETKPQGNGSFQGAVYTVQKDGQEAGVIETDAKGYGKLENIPVGKYTVKEIKAPLGYELDPETYTVEVQSSGGSQTLSVISKEKPIKVKVKIQKIDHETGEAVPQGNGSLKGAEYTVYAGENIGSVKKDTPVGKIVTDEKGTGVLENLLPGLYYIKETKSSPKYFLDQTRYQVSFPLDGGKREEVITSREKPIRGNIELQKVDAETGDNQPQVTGSTFEGAVYGIFADENIGLVNKGEKVAEITTDKKGYGKAENLFCGKYKVKEITSPSGYLPDEKEYQAEIPQTAEGDTQLRILITSREKPVRGDVSVTKILKEKEGKESIKKPGEGIHFTFTEVGNPKNQVTIVTDKNGYASTKDEKYPDGRLLYGTYKVEESNIPEGYTGIAPFEVTIQENAKTLYYIIENQEILCPVRIIKTAEDTNKIIAKAGTKFKIQKQEGEQWKDQEFLISMYPQENRQTVFETDESGSFYLPEKLNAGKYRILEIKPPTGYVLNPIPLEFSIYNGMELEEALELSFSDKPRTGKIKVVKTDKNTKEGAGAGFVFSITAGEDIYTADGTLRMKKGEEAHRITTDKKGIAISESLFPGKYLLKEEATGEYYADGGKIYEILLEAEGEEEEFQVLFNIENEKTKIEILKTEKGNREKLLEGAEFRLYSEKEINAEQAAGIQEMPEDKGQLLISDKKGKCTAENLMHNTQYYIKETKAPKGYSKNTELYKVYVDEKGLIEGKSVYALNIENAPITVEISKKGGTNKKELSGAELSLWNDQNQRIEKWTTTNKPHRISCLTPGSYTVKEEKAPKGYRKAPDLLLEIKETEEVQKTEIVDEYLTGEIQIQKKDKTTGENLGEGFEFEITAGEDIKTPDQTLICKKDSIISTIAADKEGKAQMKGLFPGKYKIREIKSGEYYARDDRQYEGEIQISEKNEIVDISLEILNVKTKFMIEKTDSVKKQPLKNVVFSAAQAMGNKKEKLSRDMVLKSGQEYITDKDGKIQLEDLKHGESYYITEAKAQDGYVLDEKVYEFHVDDNGWIDGNKEKVLKISNVPKQKKAVVKPSDNVKTKDENIPLLFLTLCLLSIGGIFVSAKSRRR